VARADLDAQLRSLSRGYAALLRQLVARRADRRALSVGVLQRRAHGGEVVLELAVTLGGDRRILFARGDLPRAVRRASTQPQRASYATVAHASVGCWCLRYGDPS
jgi:hypothetical protein